MLTYPRFNFKITHRDPGSRARLGTLVTPHGTIETPNYIFCGTKAAIKGLSPAQMREARTDIVLSNTYHLMLQPGADLVERMGGLHKFMGWDGPLLTDSGGFQVFSMGHGQVANEVKGRNKSHENKSLLEISEEGAVFRAYTDNRKILLTPENSMEIQRKLGADLLMQFDECTPYHATYDYTARSMEMSIRWGDRCLAEFERHDNGAQGVYGIVQGGVHADLRAVSATYTADRPFFGTAIGGCLGGTDEEMRGVVEHSVPHIHPDRPVHFLGIGRIRDVFTFVRLGIDTFDCVIPTRLARHGTAFLKGAPGETINLKNACYRNDPDPLDPENLIPASAGFSKAYIHHLLKAGEILGPQILAQHNVATINRLMREIRTAIRAGTLADLEREWLGSGV
ncbi:MAG: tRNA guanosine(34) transglycosylase Tgt [Alphaproteobacteria bacterium]|nr:tRNA guanosine(34) transglycosylase Tgt [Alphaproteobacteria bacterium]